MVANCWEITGSISAKKQELRRLRVFYLGTYFIKYLLRFLRVLYEASQVSCQRCWAMRLAYCPRARQCSCSPPAVTRRFVPVPPTTCRRPPSIKDLPPPSQTTATSWCCVVLRDQLREQKIKQDSLERGCGVPLTYSLSLNFMADL